MSGSPEKGETLFNIAILYSNAGYYDIAIDLLSDVWIIYGTEEGKFVVPHLANCHFHKFRETPEHSPKREKNLKLFLEYLQLAPYCDREATLFLFRDRFPGIQPEDYYAYAFKEAYGTFPKS